MFERPRRGAARLSLLAVSLTAISLCLSPISWLSSSSHAQSATAAASLEEITTVEGITEYRLSNGLQVLLFPDPSQSTFTVNVTYRVGSRHEGRGEKGMAHLLEHMVFKGTPTYPNIWGALEDHGAFFNGSTWTDRTNYYETLPATEDNLRFALHMEADRMVNSTVSAEDLASEMTVVRNEFELGENDPQGILWERMVSTAYLWHNYGNTTIGNRSDIERVPVENLRRFYERYYQPDNATLLIAGKFDVDLAKELIVEHFGANPRPERELDTTYTVEPPQDGPRSVTLRRVGDIAAAGLVYHIPAGAHSDFPAIEVLEGVLTSQPSGRLYKALVEGDLASNVWGVAFPWAQPGILSLFSEVRLDQDPELALRTMTELTETIGASEITTGEVDRIKTRLLKNIKLALTNSGRVGVQLSEWIANGDWRMYFVHRDRLKEVTVDDVRRVAQTYLIENNRTSGLYLPTEEPMRAEIPETPDVEQLVAGYEGSETIALGEDFEATPANIEERTQRLEVVPGIQAALLPKETRGDAVRASFRFHFGTEETMTPHKTALDLIPDLLMRGTTDRNFEELRDAIDQLQSRISVGGGAGIVTASIESDRDNIVAAIELLSEILREPAFAPEQWEIVRKERLTGLEEALSDPRSRSRNVMARALLPWPQDHFHYVPTLEEQIDLLNAVTIDDLRTLHRQFYGASNVELSIVGDFEPEAVVTAVTAAFGGWDSKAAYERVSLPYRTVDAVQEKILTPDKEMAVVSMGTVFEMRDDSPDYPATAFGGYILGESSKSRLKNRLRHEEGFSYGAGGYVSVGEIDARGRLITYAICAPQNAQPAIDAMREEIDRWIADGVTEEELIEGKQGYRLQFANLLSRDSYVASQLARDLEIGRTFEYLEDHLASVEALTNDDIVRVLDAYLRDAPWIEVRAGDFEREAAPGTTAGDSD